MEKKIAVLYTTIGSEKEAQQLAKYILSKKLAACINIFPGGKSLYEWEGEIKEDNEVYMLFKTIPELMSEIENTIKEHHPYKNPAILKLNAESSEQFFQYLYQNVSSNL